MFLGFVWGQNAFYIELLNERDYPMFINKAGEYNIKAGKSMRILKIKGVTNSSKIERINCYISFLFLPRQLLTLHYLVESNAI